MLPVAYRAPVAAPVWYFVETCFNPSSDSGQEPNRSAETFEQFSMFGYMAHLQQNRFTSRSSNEKINLDNYASRCVMRMA
ncbi:hypothetical protein BN2476_630126 [Paraburkholderia piptadeniae]|uniref:Uncharacterized protein n=1 Tax=Paraburkholderia piptadeniae TaxID=1701573 RepID=A0A1N7SMZ6_9BURK|nr:hypothetical protein BN2476_630126 [Paraburkholderia piptadeniae]